MSRLPPTHPKAAAKPTHQAAPQAAPAGSPDAHAPLRERAPDRSPERPSHSTVPLPRPSRWPRPCPVCGCELTRQRRWWTDRARTLLGRPVLRYRCMHAACGWYGLLQSG
ncbi:MAG: hypothetical protein ACK5QH_00135 [Rubrivivax sp.]